MCPVSISLSASVFKGPESCQSSYHAYLPESFPGLVAAPPVLTHAAWEIIINAKKKKKKTKEIHDLFPVLLHTFSLV